MMHGNSKGTAFYLLSFWLFPLFLAVGDCKLLYFLKPFTLTMVSNHSGNDSEGICNVESIQKSPLWPPDGSGATGYSLLHPHRYLQQSQYTFFRYVLSLTASQAFMQVFLSVLTFFPSVIVVQIIDDTFCSGANINTPSLIHLYDTILRFILAVALLLLAVMQTLKQSIRMYNATKQWQPNRYMQQLVQDGIFYFLVYVHFFLFHFILLFTWNETDYSMFPLNL